MCKVCKGGGAKRKCKHVVHWNPMCNFLLSKYVHMKTY